jgi:2'-5' RNA ligase
MAGSFKFCPPSFKIESHPKKGKSDVMPDENQPAFLRLFIALAVPAAVRDEIARAQGRLKRCAPPGLVRWTRPEQFHLTLKFLGDMPSAQLEALKASVTQACSEVSPIQLAAGGVGFFPSPKKPRVVWAGVRDAGGALAALHQRIHAVGLPFSPADASERFSGHITLGRFKPGHRGTMQALLERAENLSARNFGDWLANDVEIIRSELTPNGAMHTPVCVCPLAGCIMAPSLLPPQAQAGRGLG